MVEEVHQEDKPKEISEIQKEIAKPVKTAVNKEIRRELSEENDKRIEAETPEKTPVELAKEERLAVEKATADLKKENDRQEKLQANAELEGKGYSGLGKEKAEESDKEYAKRVMAGEI